MADVSREMLYRIKLTDKEFRIVGLALAGLLKRSEDKHAAAELNVALAKVRLSEAKNEVEVAAGQVEKAIAIEQEFMGIAPEVEP
jgi:hypothetical protein